ncbi:hypothetical protein GCM10010389_30670 [Streptomyces echinoruber]|uniref:Uncharacterized protein n=1 Tax=Streptomyces echinoruber TaxID=68898 RepID=A0A918R7S8_9ACTN|nr:hypothetical protein GCM10010389_30670 [Streptomyces echinoruber]
MGIARPGTPQGPGPYHGPEGVLQGPRRVNPNPVGSPLRGKGQNHVTGITAQV